MSVIAFSPAIGPVSIDCNLSEKHTSAIEITANPIETGAEVNDHAYIKPKEVTIEVADGDAAGSFNALVRLQESRVPFYLVTGLTVYNDMLIQSIDATRDRLNSKILYAQVHCRQVIIVGTASAEGGSSAPSGSNGGANSSSQSNPTQHNAANTTTATRAASTVQSGDNAVSSVSSSRSGSILSRIAR